MSGWMILPTKEDRERRDRYFASIRAMRPEYYEDCKAVVDHTRPRIDYWANEKYGFQMEFDGRGDYTDRYTITDPKKFMLFQIKYWK